MSDGLRVGWAESPTRLHREGALHARRSAGNGEFADLARHQGDVSLTLHPDWSGHRLRRQASIRGP